MDNEIEEENDCSLLEKLITNHIFFGGMDIDCDLTELSKFFEGGSINWSLVAECYAVAEAEKVFLCSDYSELLLKHNSSLFFFEALIRSAKICFPYECLSDDLSGHAIIFKDKGFNPINSHPGGLVFADSADNSAFFKALCEHSGRIPEYIETHFFIKRRVIIDYGFKKKPVESGCNWLKKDFPSNALENSSSCDIPRHLEG